MRKICALTLFLFAFSVHTYVSAEEIEKSSLECPLENQEIAPSCCSDFRLKAARIEFGAAFGSYLGIRRGYAELGLFDMVETQSNLNVFAEGRAFLLSDDDWAGSLGLGVRKSLCTCSPVIIGANVYYDYRTERFSREEDCDCCVRKSIDKSFGSIGVGVELFSEYLDFRANGYFPVKENQKIDSDFTYPGGYFARLTTTHYIPYGVDAEVSKRLNFCSQLYAVAAVGGYGYFFRHNEDAYGPFARLELGWGNYLSLQARYSYDKVYHTSVQGKVLFSIPLEQLARCFDACSTICFDPITQPVRRNYIPFTQKRCCWKWNW